MPAITFPNQRVVRIHREPVKTDFLGIKNENYLVRKCYSPSEALSIVEKEHYSLVQSAVTNGHWCGGKRPQCGASAVGLSQPF